MKRADKKNGSRIHLFAVTTIAAVALFMSAISVYGSDNPSGTSTEDVHNARIRHETEYGGICISIPTNDFRAMGYDYGDSINVKFSNGYFLEDLPYYDGYYVPPEGFLLRGVAGKDYIKACINYGEDLWKIAGVCEKDTADICLNEKGKYLSVQEASNLNYSDNRSDYASDDIFANFRNIAPGSIKEGMIYRSASPCDNKHNRAPYVDTLIKEAGVAFILDLADNEEKVRTYMDEEGFNSPYFASLYKDGRVALLSLKMNFTDDDFRSTIIEGLSAMKDNEGPYLIHCTEGKDRTGFVCMLLEALADSTYDEIIDDYMITYQNYYGIKKDDEKYEVILNNNIVPMLFFLTGEEDTAGVKSADLAECAKRYLLEGGMKEDDITALLTAIM